MDPPLDRRATMRRFLLPAAACCALLAVSYVRTAAGTAHPSPWGYRLWAFGALAYSDILALHEDRGARQHAVPYLQDKVEYPILLALGMWLPSVVAPGRSGYFALTFLLLAACALGTLWFVSAMPQASPWAWGASPALLVYSALNWDLFGILPLAAGLWLWARGSERAAVAVLSVAVWTKFFPLLVLGVLLVKKPWRQMLPLIGIFAALTVALNLPLALAARENWAWFFRYNQIRPIEPSLYSFAGLSTPAANAISAGVTGLAAVVLAALEWRTRRLDVLRASCALLCVFFIANKVYSPQYWLWVVAITALAALPSWLLTAAGLIAFADFAVSFSRLHLQADRIYAHIDWFDRSVFWPMVALRYATLAACALWAFRHVLGRPPAWDIKSR